MILDTLNHLYKNTRILVKGHSGFGGIWLCNWLSMLGADVLGYSDELISERNPFTHEYLKRAIREVKGDIRDFGRIEKTFLDYQPTMVFHLAAQAIVITSYQRPKETFATNVNGTLNLLNAVRETKSVSVLIAVITDKVYKDQGNRVYAENDLCALL
jgi:CDP-glucose 4,6-dehydratase